jgi:hypothetical protein
MAIPLVVIVGADKGGVGKTTMSRALLDYFKTQNIECRAFDTETPLGVLKRFHNDKTKLVDLTRSDGQMEVFDTLGASAVTVIDVRAGLLSPTLKTLADIGFLDSVKEGKIKVVVLHVLGSSLASFNEIKTTQAALPGCQHFLITNHINGAEFFKWDGDTARLALSVGDGVLDIPKLDELAVEHVETAGMSFLSFKDDTSKSFVIRGYVRNWLKDVFEQFAKAKLNV